ncbi:divinyl chlorophyllide a 8-vinyl-reductase, chloroplastic [Cornus florida]|uniref:divinyl chlorophyllide a 8-vinyl-reductase, chloroplastic n=1 Tax=Cornus florida TaxID=4283 RepID=UPI002899B082|nr:divinyl chlorophyllide a 8-vinyl-reductase, chloroplastic [Cornus florida]
MSICVFSNGFTLNSPRAQSFKRLFSSHFINPIQVSSVPYALPFSSVNLSKPSKFSRERFRPITATTTPTVETPKLSFRNKTPKDINILVVGSTGYIGNIVVKELVKRGFNVIAIARERSGIRGKNSKEETLEKLNGANVCFSDVTNLDDLQRSLENFGGSIDVVVSCLASRNGGIKDSWKIDYEATKNSLVAGRNRGASHFVLLSAICVQKPLLEFQRAKLKFEAELMKEAEEDAGFTYSIVRPTAFFKSLGGQVELVKDGKPYVMFGDGKLCACKPISEPDLASFIADCVLSEDKINQVLPIGGPGKALTPMEQGEMLFRLVGREPKFLKVPIQIMDFAIGFLDFLVKIFPQLEDTAEFGKIGRYYAAESMLVLDPETGEYSAEKTPSYGKDTLEEFFERVLRQGIAGQELGEQTIF